MGGNAFLNCLYHLLYMYRHDVLHQFRDNTQNLMFKSTFTERRVHNIYFWEEVFLFQKGLVRKSPGWLTT